MHTLSKSKLIAYRQCPKRLWLELHKPELRNDSGKEALFATGNQVGAVARRVFDPEGSGVNLDPHEIGWEASAEQTKAILETGGRAAFEAYLAIPGALALADVMRPDSASDELRWEMIEVKAAASVRDYHRDDVAIQTYIADQSGIRLARSGLAHIDNSFLYLGDGNYQGLFHVEDLTDEARQRRDEVEEWIREAQQIAALTEEPAIEVGKQCSDPFPCAFCTYCYRDMEPPEDPFHMLPHLSAPKRAAFAENGFRVLNDIPLEWLSAKQVRVRSAHLSGEVFFDQAQAFEQLSQHPGPTYFLDFETVQFAVPVWSQSHPYEGLPFQYSLHRLDEDGNLYHSEFLALDGKDPRRALAAQLIADCGTHGVIYAYNASFEKRVVAGLASVFPDLRHPLEALSNRIQDLLPLARECYYNPCQNGHWGLKYVAPAIAPDLCYSDLEGVQVGSDAGTAYWEAISPETTDERREELRHQLLEYCKLDTLATVRIWEFFMGRG